VTLSIEDQALDHFWRRHFNQPLPMTGAGQAVRAILKTKGVSGGTIEAAIRRLEAGKPVEAANARPRRAKALR
jgi:hypothetical protein